MGILIVVSAHIAPMIAIPVSTPTKGVGVSFLKKTLTEPVSMPEGEDGV